jgi:hypothetical protein
VDETEAATKAKRKKKEKVVVTFTVAATLRTGSSS